MAEYLRYKGLDIRIVPNVGNELVLVCLTCDEIIGRPPRYILENKLYGSSSEYLEEVYSYIQKTRPSILEHLEDHRIVIRAKRYHKNPFPRIRLIRE